MSGGNAWSAEVTNVEKKRQVLRDVTRRIRSSEAESGTASFDFGATLIHRAMAGASAQANKKRSGRDKPRVAAQRQSHGGRGRRTRFPPAIRRYMFSELEVDRVL